MNKKITIKSKKEYTGAVSYLGLTYDYLPVKHILPIIVEACEQCSIRFNIEHISNQKLIMDFACSKKQLKSIKNALIINFNEHYDFY